MGRAMGCVGGYVGTVTLALVLAGCVPPPRPGADGGPRRDGDFGRALRLAGLAGKPLVLVSTASVTPRVPVDGDTSLIAGEPKSWEPSAGTGGEIALPANSNASPLTGGYAGLRFSAQANLTYLTFCTLDSPGTTIRFAYDGVATGIGQVSPSTAEFVVGSDKVAVGGPAFVVFDSEQGDHKLLGCKLYGFTLG